MGKILPFKKGAPPEMAPQDNELQAQVARVHEAVTNLFPVIERTFEKMGFELDPTLKIELHLSSLIGAISMSAVATARMGLREVDKDVLLAIARTTNHHQWTARPGYFQALVEEIRSR